jgi:hypothetical protein
MRVKGKETMNDMIERKSDGTTMTENVKIEDK